MELLRCCGAEMYDTYRRLFGTTNTGLHSGPPTVHVTYEYETRNAINVPMNGLQGGDVYTHPSGCDDDNSCARGMDRCRDP